MIVVGRIALMSGELGQLNGLPVSIIIRTTLQDLESRAGIGVTGGGTKMPVKDVLRLAAHSNLFLAVFNKATGSAMDLFRARRVASLAQRIMLIGREGGCTKPGCTVGPYGCQVHHAIADWADDGQHQRRRHGLGLRTGQPDGRQGRRLDHPDERQPRRRMDPPTAPRHRPNPHQLPPHPRTTPRPHRRRRPTTAAEQRPEPQQDNDTGDTAPADTDTARQPTPTPTPATAHRRCRSPNPQQTRPRTSRRNHSTPGHPGTPNPANPHRPNSTRTRTRTRATNQNHSTPGHPTPSPTPGNPHHPTTTPPNADHPSPSPSPTNHPHPSPLIRGDPTPPSSRLTATPSHRSQPNSMRASKQKPIRLRRGGLARRTNPADPRRPTTKQAEDLAGVYRRDSLGRNSIRWSFSSPAAAIRRRTLP